MPMALGVGFWALLTCAVAWVLVPRAERLARALKDTDADAQATDA